MRRLDWQVFAILMVFFQLQAVTAEAGRNDQKLALTVLDRMVSSADYSDLVTMRTVTRESFIYGWFEMLSNCIEESMQFAATERVGGKFYGSQWTSSSFGRGAFASNDILFVRLFRGGWDLPLAFLGLLDGEDLAEFQGEVIRQFIHMAQVVTQGNASIRQIWVDTQAATQAPEASKSEWTILQNQLGKKFDQELAFTTHVILERLAEELVNPQAFTHMDVEVKPSRYIQASWKVVFSLLKNPELPVPQKRMLLKTLEGSIGKRDHARFFQNSAFLRTLPALKELVQQIGDPAQAEWIESVAETYQCSDVKNLF